MINLKRLLAVVSIVTMIGVIIGQAITIWSTPEKPFDRIKELEDQNRGLIEDRKIDFQLRNKMEEFFRVMLREQRIRNDDLEGKVK